MVLRCRKSYFADDAFSVLVCCCESQADRRSLAAESGATYARALRLAGYFMSSYTRHCWSSSVSVRSSSSQPHGGFATMIGTTGNGFTICSKVIFLNAVGAIAGAAAVKIAATLTFTGVGALFTH
jgi:hypothetical protein